MNERENRRLFTVGPDDDPLWVRLYVQGVGGHWAAKLVAAKAPPPAVGTHKGLAFFRATPEDADHAAKGYLGRAEPAN